MPAFTNIELLLGFLSDHGNLREAFVRLEESIYIDFPPALCKSNMLLFAQRLAAKKQQAMVGKKLVDVREFGVVKITDIDIGNFTSDALKFINAHISICCYIAGYLDDNRFTVRIKGSDSLASAND